MAEQMLMVDDLLGGFASGAISMHPARYQALAGWVRASFSSSDSGALRALRDVAPQELQGIVENVLHERRVISWAADDIVGLSSLAECLNLLNRLRRRRPARSGR
ncbi:MAG: hypothetical protein ABL916_15645 [Burkholderiaceae bacterium]